jgi:hypothetical protein
MNPAHESPHMTTQDKITFKTLLKQTGIDLINERITTAKRRIDDAQESANQEEKSSAGDKYETGRAMGHLEKELHSRQLSENLKELALLQDINTGVLYTAAASGAFIACPPSFFFLAAGLGKQTVDGKTILFLSPFAPLAKLILHKKTGDTFLFKGFPQRIEELF